MILSRDDLRAALQSGEIGFVPEIEDSQIGEASIDLRIGSQFTQLKEIPGLSISLANGLKNLSELRLWDTVNVDNSTIGANHFEIKSKEFVLAKTHESITVPRNMIARVEGRSTYARFGISMHQTAPWIQPGWSGSIVLELMNNGPITIKMEPMKDRPCQLSFFRLTSEVHKEFAYGAKSQNGFQNQEHPFKP